MTEKVCFNRYLFVTAELLILFGLFQEKLDLIKFIVKV
jgi:hypothetical protein